MAINTKLPDYNNTEGQIFSLRVVNAPATKGHEDRWEFLVVAKNEAWGREEFRVLMSKSAYSCEQKAEEAVLGEPLEEVKERLDSLGEEAIDLFEVDLSRGWTVL